MSEQQSNLMVVKISTALSNHPLFVRISDSNVSIDHIVAQAIESLNLLGKPLEATQLTDLYKSHQIFNNGVVMQKGSLFTELATKNQTVGNAVVKVAELDLISSHSGGIVLNPECAYIKFEKCVECVNCGSFLNCLRHLVAQSGVNKERKAYLLGILPD